MSKSYIREHLKPSILDEEEMIFEVQADIHYPDLIRVHFQSRHSKMKKYNATVHFNSEKQTVEEWYCTCQTGPRKLGCCTHVCASLWHLGVNRAQILQTHPLSAAHLLQFVEDSNAYSRFEESDEDDEDILYSLDNDIDMESDSS